MFIYRCYDERGELLYVGITEGHWLYRIQQHSKKPWYRSIRKVEVELHHKPLEWVRAEEARQIRTLRPAHNQEHNGLAADRLGDPHAGLDAARRALKKRTR